MSLERRHFAATACQKRSRVDRQLDQSVCGFEKSTGIETRSINQLHERRKSVDRAWNNEKLRRAPKARVK